MALKVLSGSNADLSSTSNWSGASLPSNGDDVVCRSRTVAFTSGLSSLASITLNSFRVEASFTSTLGTLTTPAEIDSDDFSWAGTGTGYVDFGSAVIDSITITGGTFHIANGSAIDTIYALGGTTQIATEPTESATVARVVAGSNSAGPLPVVTIGSNVSLTDLTVNNSAVSNSSSIMGDVVVAGLSANYTVSGSANHSGTLTISAGVMTDMTTGTIADLTVAGNGVYSAATSPQPKTISACTMSGGSIQQLNGNVTFTNPITFTGNSITVA